jgi:hypothetical protein
LKAVLLVYVVVGKAKKIASSQAAVTQPPAGYDSVRSMYSPPLEHPCDCL